MKYSFWVSLIIFFYISPCLVYGQKKILFATSGDVQQGFVEKNGLIDIIIFYQNEFVNYDGIRFNSKAFKEFLDKKIPDKSQSGYATLDWEGKALEILSSKKSSSRQVNSVKREFIKALKYAKKERPNIKWSYYGLPSRIYWHINTDWEDINMRLLDIFKKQDFISPSLYVLYLENESTESNNLNYINKNVSFALELGDLLNKPVMPFIFHRNRTPKKEDRDSLVEIELWDFYLKNISKCRFNGKGIDGVIWWHSERFHFLNREKMPAVKREYMGVTDSDDHQLDIFNRYLKSIKKNLE